jgi:hypothetical protein
MDFLGKSFLHLLICICDCDSGGRGRGQQRGDWSSDEWGADRQDKKVGLAGFSLFPPNFSNSLNKPQFKTFSNSPSALHIRSEQANFVYNHTEEENLVDYSMIGQLLVIERDVQSRRHTKQPFDEK